MNIIASEENNKGWIYCFTNPVYSNLCKVGYTEKTVEERCKRLFSTGFSRKS